MNTLTPPNYDNRSLRALYELFVRHHLVTGYNVTCAWGADEEDRTHGLPLVRWQLGDRERFDRGGQMRAAETALPRGPGGASQLVVAKTLWTRYAAADLWLYAGKQDGQGIEWLIDLTVSALDELLVSSGNWEIVSGSGAGKDGYADASDAYCLQITVKVPVLQLQRRIAAEATELTTEVNFAP